MLLLTASEPHILLTFNKIFAKFVVFLLTLLLTLSRFHIL